ncbi:hypothetical protein ACFU5Y_14060 [Streptomyces gardneri]|uniref:hypothetical protein n=1 Tax=Streptomyces gardneri TaxID=66892 RepID=UPI0036A749EC
MKTTRSTALAGVVALAAALTALTGCSGGGDGEAEGPGPETVKALKVCEEVLGAGGVSAARATLGDSDFRAESLPLAKVGEAMLKEARSYVPGSEDLSRSTYEPCRMSTAEGETVRRVDARVQWSVFTMDSVTVDDKQRKWTKAAEDVYVQRERQPMDALVAVVPCRVPGAAAGQERELPLQVSVRSQGIGTDGETLSGKLLTPFVRDTQKRLGCVDPVTIPESLLPQ